MGEDDRVSIGDLFTLNTHIQHFDSSTRQNVRTITRSDHQIAVGLVILNDGHQISRRNLPLADLLENLPPLRVVPPKESLQILQIIYRRNGEKTRGEHKLASKTLVRRSEMGPNRSRCRRSAERGGERRYLGSGRS